MNPDLPPMKNEELEEKITALLLGELLESEAQLLRALIDRDPALAKVEARLKLAIGLMRETVKTPEVAPTATLRMSDAKREALLAKFKTVVPKEFAQNKVSISRLLVAVAVIAISVGLAAPYFLRTHMRSRQANLSELEENYGKSVGSDVAPATVFDSTVRTTYPTNSSVSQLPGWSAKLHARGNLFQTDGKNASQIVLPTTQVTTTPLASPSAGMLVADSPMASPPGSSGFATNSPEFIGGLKDPVANANQPVSNQSGRVGGAVVSRAEVYAIMQSLYSNRTLSDSQAPLTSRYAGDANRLVASNPQPVPSTDIMLPQSSGGMTGGTGLPSEAPVSKPVVTTESGRRNPVGKDLDSNTEKAAVSGDISEGKKVVSEDKLFGIKSAEKQISDAESTANQQKQNELSREAMARAYQARDRERSANGRIENEALQKAKNPSGVFPGPIAVGGGGGAGGQKTADGSAMAFNYSVDKDTQSRFAGGENPLATAKKLAEDVRKLNDVGVPVASPQVVFQPEIQTATSNLSTFSLNVSDASYKLAEASLQNGVMPEPGNIRSEEFVNAFDYRDQEPVAGAPIGFAWERVAYPFAHNRDLLRFSVKTAAQGRQPGRPLNIVLLLDKSGSMERADRVQIIHQALQVLSAQLLAQDTFSVVTFARTARLAADGLPGNQAGDVAKKLDDITPEGGTNLEEAMRLAYATAMRHYQAKGENRVVLLTDGAANLGEVKPEMLKALVDGARQQGISLDCFGIGWEGYNDTLMETLSRTGHGRYGFINSPEQAATKFANQIAGALHVAAADVKVQVEFNPKRVTVYRQIGYARHQLAAQDFRNNKVAAAQIGAAEAGTALYTAEVNPLGEGPLCTVRVRFHAPGSENVEEHAWEIPYQGTPVALENSSAAMKLAATASAFSEWLSGSPFAAEVTSDRLLASLKGVPEAYGVDVRPKNLEWMIRQAKSLTNK